MNSDSLLASFEPKVLKTDSIVFSSPFYTPHELSVMGWRWKPIIRSRSRVECSNCKFKCDVQENISKIHLRGQQSCPLAQIWVAREEAAQNGWSIHGDNIFTDPKSIEGFNIRLETFIPKQKRKSYQALKWCQNSNAPSPELLAKNGFYYNPKLANDDRCTCMYCGIHIQDWTSPEEVDIEVAHSTANDQCWVWTHHLLVQREKAKLELEAKKNPHILSQSELMASFNGKTINGQTIEFKGSIYPRNVLANMGWLWKPTLESQLSIQCFYCKYQCDVQPDLCSVHLTNSVKCPLALIMASIERNVVTSNPNSWKNDETFNDPASEKSKNIRLLTFPNGGDSWSTNEKAPPVSVLIENGFYYNPKIPNDDRCTCMYCGLDLMDWEDGDDNEVILSHTNESPDCYVIQHNKLPPQISPVDNDDDDDIPMFDQPVSPLREQSPRRQLMSTPPVKRKGTGTSEDPIDMDNETVEFPQELQLEIVEPDEMEDLLSKVSSPSKSSPVKNNQPIFPTLKSTDLSEFFSELDVDQSEKRPLSYFKNRLPPQKSQLQDDESPPIVYDDFNAYDGFDDRDSVAEGDNHKEKDNENPVESIHVDSGQANLSEHEENPLEKAVDVEDKTSNTEVSVDKFYDATEVVMANESISVEHSKSSVSDDKDARIQILENALELLKKQMSEFSTKSNTKPEVLEVTDTYDEIQVSKNKELPELEHNGPLIINKDREMDNVENMDMKEIGTINKPSKLKRTKSQIDDSDFDSKREERKLKKIKKKLMKQHIQTAADTTDDLLHLSHDTKEDKKKKKKEKKEKKKAKKLKKSIFSQTQTQTQEQKQEQNEDNEAPRLQLPSSEINLVGNEPNAITPIHRLNHHPNGAIGVREGGIPISIGPMKLSVSEEEIEEVSPTLQKSMGRTTDSQKSQLSITSRKLDSLDKLMMLSPPPINGIQSSSPMPMSKYKSRNDVEMMTDLIEMGGNQSTPHHQKVLKDVVIRGNEQEKETTRSDGNKYQKVYSELAVEIGYIKEVVDNRCEMLSEDLDGLLTEFVSELKPEQLQMTIREWLLYQQNEAESHIRDKCSEMEKHFKKQCQLAIGKLESL